MDHEQTTDCADNDSKTCDQQEKYAQKQILKQTDPIMKKNTQNTKSKPKLPARAYLGAHGACPQWRNGYNFFIKFLW